MGIIVAFGSPDWRTTVRRFLTGVGVLIASLAAIGFVLTRVGPFEPVLDWDESVNATLADSRSAWATGLARRVTRAGDTEPIVAFLAVVLAALALARRWRAMWFLPLALLAEIVTFLTVNHLVARPRPTVERVGPLPGTFSFPSGHIAATLVCWFGAALLLWVHRRVVLARLAAIAAAVMTVAMGWARVYVGMHHPIDVALGLVMGAAALLIAAHAMQLHRVNSGRDAPARDHRSPALRGVAQGR